ncbi:MAG TPA: hypothetical protein VJB14_15990, partial [Planctomycetota bacterium]|nr:hypothetical protein [Planctomycetota bacterium]
MKKPLKKHLEMEALFGADFLPISRKGRSAAAPPQAAPPRAPAKPVPAAPPKAAGPAYPQEYLEYM